jgi:hypothetical protein
MGNLAMQTHNEPINIDKNTQSYHLFLVFTLPPPLIVANHAGKLHIEPENFLLSCLIAAQDLNQLNLMRSEQNSGAYFTDLNHLHRHRIPKTLKRLNSAETRDIYGIMSLVVFKDEVVKNKVHNQRTSSVNPNIIELSRIKAIYYPLTYRTEQLIDLYPLGRVDAVDQEDFHIVWIDPLIIDKAKLL